MEPKAKLTQYLNDITKQRGSFSSEAIVEPNPSSPRTAECIMVDALRAEVLVSCRIVPDNQYILAKLADFNWVGNGYSNVKYPKIGEQVIILFLRNDINSGVIVGRMPSIEEPVQPLVSSLNTVTKDEFGNEMIWDAAGIKITDATGNEIETSATGITVTSSTGVRLTISASGTITLEADTEVDITAPNTVINGNLQVTGTVAATGDVTAGIISLMLHTHQYNPGPGSPTPTGPPV